MRCLDAPLLSAAAPVLSRLRSTLGLKHWQLISCIDALFAGSLVLFLLVSHNDWLLLGFPAYAILPSVRKAEFSSLEEAADLVNQPMRNMRQELLAFCWLRYVSYLIYVWLLAHTLWLGALDGIAALPLMVGLAKALAEAVDIYPTGKAARSRSKIFWLNKTAESLS